MKTLTIFFIMIGAFFILYGCKKYTCQCEVLISGTITTPPQNGGSSTFTVKGPKNKAIKKCKSYSSEETNGSKTECALK